MKEYTALFKALGQDTRIEILKVLAEKEMCVCELAEVIGTSQPRISQHLKILKNAGLVSEITDGPWRIYRLDWYRLTSTFQGFTCFLHQKLAETPGYEEKASLIQEFDDDFRTCKTKDL